MQIEDLCFMLLSISEWLAAVDEANGVDDSKYTLDFLKLTELFYPTGLLAGAGGKQPEPTPLAANLTLLVSYYGEHPFMLFFDWGEGADHAQQNKQVMMFDDGTVYEKGAQSPAPILQLARYCAHSAVNLLFFFGRTNIYLHIYTTGQSTSPKVHLE
jgi:hypothetical protein